MAAGFGLQKRNANKKKAMCFGYLLLVWVLATMTSFNRIVYTSSDDPNDSGYDHGCDDAGIPNLSDRYINQPFHMLALIPVDDSNTRFYSIEARKPVGFDNGEIPSRGILIHRIDTSDFNPGGVAAQVVDRTIDFNPNDEGAVWTPGKPSGTIQMIFP